MGKVKDIMIQLEDLMDEYLSIKAENQALYQHIEGLFDIIDEQESTIIDLEVDKRRAFNSLDDAEEEIERLREEIRKLRGLYV